jgi:hypothetical protein
MYNNHHIAQAMAEAAVVDRRRAAAGNRHSARVRPRRHRRAIAAGLVGMGAPALVGAAIAGSIGAPAASARPADQAAAGHAATPCVPPPPSSIAASAAKEYQRLRSACTSSSTAPGRAASPSPSAPGASPGKTPIASDARDAAQGGGTFDAPAVTVVKLPPPKNDSAGIQWAEIGIGAGGTLGLVVLGTGVAFLRAGRPHRRPRSVETAAPTA